MRFIGCCLFALAGIIFVAGLVMAAATWVFQAGWNVIFP